MHICSMIMRSQHQMSSNAPASLARLNAFRAIMNAGTVTAAAKQLGISQPALSRQITALEEELGLTLFSRFKKRLVPSREAEALLHQVNRILAAVEEIPTFVRQIRSGAQTRLRVVVTPRLAAGILAPALATFTRQQPNVTVAVEVLARADLERWMAREQFDLGLSAFPVNSSIVEGEPLFEVPAVVAVPKHHALARRKSVRADDLRTATWVSTIKGTRIRAETDELFRVAGFEPAVRVEASNTILASLLVASGVGVMLTDPISARAIGADRISALRWEPAHLMRFGLLLPRIRPPSSTAGWLIQVIRDTALEASRGIAGAMRDFE
jgi:DNA-binding transcriptional LysR family regulator